MKRLARILVLVPALACATTEGDSKMPLPAYLPNFDELWDFTQPAETEQKFLRLLPQAAAAENAEYHAQLLTQIARAQGLQREFDTAHETLDQAELLLSDRTPTARVRTLLERGRAFNSAGEPESSVGHFREAWDFAREHELHIHAVDAAHMMAIVEEERALEWNLAALNHAEESGDEHAAKWYGSLYNNIGWNYHDRGDYERAMDMFQKCFVFRAETKNERGARIAKWCIARTLRSQGRAAEALDMQRELALELEQLGETDGFVNEELGELLLDLGHTDQAAAQFARAHELLSADPNFVVRNGPRLERILELSQPR